MKLNEKIILCRKKCGISQEALGNMVGVSRQAVSKWETGDALPEVTKLKALADVFGVTVDYLLSDEGENGESGGKADAPPTDGASNPDGQAARAEYTYGTNFVHSEGSGLSERVSIFLKSYGWIGGIVLIVFGAYRAVVSLVMVITVISEFSVIGNIDASIMPDDFSVGGIGSFALPGVLGILINLAVAVAMIVGGAYIIKRFKPKKK